MNYRVVTNRSELAAYRTDWDSLSAEAIEPNVFYERYLLESALENLSLGSFKGLLIFSSSAKLIGFFPLSDKSRYRGLPLRFLGSFEYMHCYLSTPLVRKGYERECFDKFFNWLDCTACRPFVEFRMCSLDGPFTAALSAYLNATGRTLRVTNKFDRALISSTLSPDQYLEAILNKKRRKELSRLRRRLEEKGTLEVDILEIGGDIDGWTRDFLRIEASGWKGEKGTALNHDPAQRKFFEEVLRRAFNSEKLIMLRLSLNGEPIAMQAHFRSGQGSFSFKIAYDEKFAAYSPGVLLELDLIRYLLNENQIAWMDSCADPNHSMINRLWMERRSIGHIVIARRSALSLLTVYALSSAHYLYRLYLRRNNHEREAFAV